MDYSNTNYLQLNISETKELFIYFSRTASPPPAVVINGVEVEMASSYKFLGVHLNDYLSWSDQVGVMVRNAEQHVTLHKNNGEFDVRTEIINICHNSTIGGA